jgi:hypothetical protein
MNCRHALRLPLSDSQASVSFSIEGRPVTKSDEPSESSMARLTSRTDEDPARSISLPIVPGIP